jgi:serine/threonine protein kinase
MLDICTSQLAGNRRKRALLEWQQRLHIVKGIANGVNHLSSANVIHRDLKPANVLLDRGWNAKVADFGTAKLLVDEATGTLPKIGTR